MCLKSNNNEQETKIGSNAEIHGKDLNRVLTKEKIRGKSEFSKINPQNLHAWFNKGLALDHLNKSDEAIKAYDKAIEINPRDSKAWVGKGDVLIKLGNTQMILEKQMFIEILFNSISLFFCI